MKNGWLMFTETENFCINSLRRFSPLVFLLFGLLIALLPPPVHAITIFSRSLDLDYYGLTSHHANDQEMFDSFSLTQSATLNEITWYGQFSSGTTANDSNQGNFNIYLFHDNPQRDPESYSNTEGLVVDHLPDEVAFLTFTYNVIGLNSGLADPLQGGDVKEWTMSVPEFSLNAGTYWLSISASESEPGWFLWNRGVSEESMAVFGAVTPENTADFQVTSEHGAMAFSLEYNVPDNGSTIVMLGTILLVLAGLHRRVVCQKV